MYFTCPICGRKLGAINHNHLKQHLDKYSWEELEQYLKFPREEKGDDAREKMREVWRKAYRRKKEKNPERLRMQWKKDRTHKTKREKELGIILKQQLIDELGGKCAKCGLSDIRVLVFHHKNGRHLFDKTQYKMAMGGFAHKMRRLIEEKDNLEVLCANCHMILHCEEREQNNGNSSEIVL